MTSQRSADRTAELPDHAEKAIPTGCPWGLCASTKACTSHRAQSRATASYSSALVRSCIGSGHLSAVILRLADAHKVVVK